MTASDLITIGAVALALRGLAPYLQRAKPSSPPPSFVAPPPAEHMTARDLAVARVQHREGVL